MKKLFIPFVLLLLLTDSCKKKEENNGTTGNTSVYKTYGSMDEIYDLLSLKPKVVTFDAATGSKFYGNSGTQYIFQPNCLQDATGASVTGTVRVEVTEWLKKGDMVFSGMLSMSYGEILVSGGEIDVRVSKDGNEVFLKPGMTFEAKVPQFGSMDSAMQFFKGDETGNKADRVNWRLKKNDTIPPPPAIPWIKPYDDSLGIVSDSFRSCNADMFQRELGEWFPQTFTITVVMKDGSTPAWEDVHVYALLDNFKSVVPQDHKFKNGVVSEDHIPTMPCHFVAFGLINGHFYGGVVAATPKTGENYTVTLTEVKPEEFKAQLALYP